ncbi:MAG: PQQ-binding-like beta-propeller repeat protein [Opitutaceae bacterium]|nr:PQQ-binding-like beta-propeller repeat protein [Opitutaceae bacterium]
MVVLLTGIAPVFGAAGRDWAAYLGDTGATHYSTLSAINATNVTKLERAWEFRTGDASANNRSQIQCNPLVIDGVLYGTSPQLKLFALDAATGKELWRFNPFEGGGPEAARGLNRGLTMWREGDERRLMFSAGSFLHAVDPDTGKLIASFGDTGRINLLNGLDRDVSGMYLTGNTPGALYRDLIIVSVRVGEGPGPAAPGHICAYDVRTGKRRWIFHTIPHPGEPGYETWPAEAWKTAGGANCWAGLVVDHERGLAFVPTGSAAFDFWGGDRLGSNLYANCLLALDAATGERRWHFQFVHHDMWDRDPPAAPVLCEVMNEGKKVAAVAQVTKSAHVWVFDRVTGRSLFPWREHSTPASALRGEEAWPTQPMPLIPAPFARQRFRPEDVTERTPAAQAAVKRRLEEVSPHQPWDPPSERGTIILPGFDGGAEWGGPAVDPRGVLYVNSNEMPWILQMVPTSLFTEGAGPLYAQLCIGCHGPNREGNPAQNIPSLVNIMQRLQYSEILAMLRTGKGVMPSFNFLPDRSKQALVEFLLAPDKPPSTAPTAPTARETVGGSGARSPYVTTGYNRFVDPDGYPAIRPPWGTLNALDLNTGKYLWQRTLGELPELTAAGIPPTGTENYGGPIVTAGGVLFIGATKDEKFRAFSAATGELLWETSLPAGGYATPATYEVGGRQYVVIACGGGKMGTKSGDAYVAFALP